LGEASESADAAFNLDGGSDSQVTLIKPDEAGAVDTKPGSAPKFVPGTSPLCNVMANSGCDPDEVACLYDATDGGLDSGSCTLGAVCAPENGGPPVLKAACRVESSNPVCSTAYGTGAQDRCTTSADCDIGYECTGAATGDAEVVMGTCKHYCCDGDATCTALGSNWFCDIEPVFHGIDSVPVCTFGVACTPFGDGCAETDTCTLVNEVTIETACVTPGAAAVGDECTKVKCGANLACISDTCRQLCKLTAADAPDGAPGQCPANQTCIASSLLGSYTDVGLCGTLP
jgi:hypothetical protein